MNTRTQPLTHWPAVLAAAFCGVASAMNIGKVPPALPVLRAELGLTLVQAGWVSSMLTTIAVFASLVIGLVSARLGSLPMVIAGLLLGAAASAGGMLASAYPALLAARFFEGAGFLAVVVSAPGLISVAAAQHDRRFALGMWSAFMPAGAGLALAVSPLLLASGGWRALWLASTAALLLAVALAWSQRSRYRSAGGGTRAGQLADALAVLRQPAPWALALAFGLWALQHFALIVWLPSYLKEQRALGDTAVALLTGAMLLANVPGNLIGGMLLQRGFRRGRLIAFAHCVTGLCAIGLFVEDWPDALRYALTVALSFVGGLIPSSVLSSSTALARTPQQIGVLQGLLMQGSQLGQFVGTPLIAAVVAASGHWSAARWVMAGAAAIGAALGAFVAAGEARKP